MFTDGLVDTLKLVLAIVAVVTIVAVVIRRSAERNGEAKGYRKRRRGLPDKREWICPNCDTPYGGASRFCYSCKDYATIGDDPGSTQMMVFMGWLPALVAAAVGGTIGALIAWEPWPLLIVLLAGPLLGWFATVAFFFWAGQLWWRHSRSEGMAGLVMVTSWLGVGPAVAIVLAILVTLVWM